VDVVFISYASEDRERIVPIVQTIRTMAPGQVFQDYLSIVPGERWRERILEALAEASTVFVFWCTHSAASEFVREEYEAGLRWQKTIVPVLLDGTPRPESLEAVQHLDFRRTDHGGLDDFEPGTFRRNKNVHFYPYGPDGDPLDWQYKNWAERERERETRWKEDIRARRRAIADAIVDRASR
jgi:hypothetical protein